MCSAWEPSPFHGHPHRVSIQKAKGKDQKNQKGQSLEAGATPTPLQATSSQLLGDVRGKTRAQRLSPHLWQHPEDPSVFSITAQASTPLLPSGQGKGLYPQYLLIPKIRTPWSWGSLGMSTLIKDTVLRMKWIWSYLV